ncbi:MAG: NAD(P)/FAD-dependent oxidoreductase [Desulfomonile sp.]|nr:NAD(P)/FAD-dependent oxidoreductase [Desulfomonile sp.]
MAKDHVVIIGNGPAANEAAIALRERAPELRVTIVGREHVRQYKPHFLPALIAGKITEHDLFVRPIESYSQAGIKLRLGQEVVDVDFDTRRVILAHKEVLRFDGLIIATGGKPRIPEPFLVFQDVMMTLKTLADARVWIEKLARVDSVLIVGGDLTSVAFAKALVSMGKTVKLMVDEHGFWPLHLGDETRQEVAQRLASSGMELVACRKLKGLARVSADEIRVETDCGRYTVGAVGAFFGLVPDVKFLARSGLYIERGIIVDESLMTHYDGVYAAGDCAQVYHPALRDYWVSIGYRNAENLGRIAALNLIGGKVCAETPPESIFHVEGVKVPTSWWAEI